MFEKHCYQSFFSRRKKREYLQIFIYNQKIWLKDIQELSSHSLRKEDYKPKTVIYLIFFSMFLKEYLLHHIFLLLKGELSSSSSSLSPIGINGSPSQPLQRNTGHNGHHLPLLFAAGHY